ncbi:class I SAM-dependent methyltransferase [soil metagenome]
MDATAKQQRVWDREAAGWDATAARLERGLFAGGREWIGSRASGRVLEVGIGTGRSIPYYPADATVTGVELSPEMLAIARRRVAELGSKAELLQGDAEHLPFDAESFDTVVAQLTLCSIPHNDVAIREMARVLRPGGSLLLIDHVGSSWPPIYAGMWVIERVTILTAGEHFTRRQLPLVESAGLRVVERERLKLGIIERIRATKS